MAKILLNLEVRRAGPDQPEEDGSIRLPRPRQTLRVGFSTGSAAAAPGPGAPGGLPDLALSSPRGGGLLNLPCSAAGEGSLPGGGSLTIPLLSHGRHGSRGEALVVKDAGDDPDATHGAEIGAPVWFSEPGSRDTLILRGGGGVGRGTKPRVSVGGGAKGWAG